MAKKNNQNPTTKKSRSKIPYSKLSKTNDKIEIIRNSKKYKQNIIITETAVANILGN